MAPDPLAALYDDRYLGDWLGDGNHYRMQLAGDAADNPDQRIAEDMQQFIDGGSNGVGICRSGSACSMPS